MFEHLDLLSKVLKAWDRFQDRRRAILAPVLLELARDARAGDPPAVVTRHIDKVLAAATPIGELKTAIAELLKESTK